MIMLRMKGRLGDVIAQMTAAGALIVVFIGVFLIGLIRDGSVLLDINDFTQNVIISVVIWLAVLWDQFRRRRTSSLSS